MKFSPFLALLIAASSFGIHSAEGVVIAEYLFTTPTDETTTINPYSSDVEPYSVASEFTVSGGLNAAGAAVSGSSDMAFIRGDSLTTTDSGAYTNGDYFQFTVTPEAGVTLNLTTLTFSYGGSNSGTGSTAFTTYFFLRTDAGANADDFSTDLGSSFSLSRGITGATSNNQMGNTSPALNLSGADFQNITTPVTFRIYAYTSDSANGKINRIDTVILNGTVVVPEPSAAVIGLMSLGTLTLLRKRH